MTRPGKLPRWRVARRDLGSMSVAEIWSQPHDARPAPGSHRDTPERRRGSAVPAYTPKAGDTTHSWYVIDATDVVLGRLAVEAAKLLPRKHTQPVHTHR